MMNTVGGAPIAYLEAFTSLAHVLVHAQRKGPCTVRIGWSLYLLDSNSCISPDGQ